MSDKGLIKYDQSELPAKTFGFITKYTNDTEIIEPLIADCIQYLYRMLNLQIPSKEVLFNYADLIIEYHKEFRVSDIKEAFKRFLANKLDFTDANDYKVYNKLTIEIISKILVSYKRVKQKENIEKAKLNIQKQESEFKEADHELYLIQMLNLYRQGIDINPCINDKNRLGLFYFFVKKASKKPVSLGQILLKRINKDYDDSYMQRYILSCIKNVAKNGKNA